MFFWLQFIHWHFALTSLPIEDIPIFVRVNFTQHGFFPQGIMKLLFTVHDLTLCSLRQAWKQGLSSIFESASEVAQSCPTLCHSVDCSLHQASLSMGFSRQEYWSGLPFPSPQDLPDPGIELWSQGLNPGLQPYRKTLYPLSHREATPFLSRN